MGWKNPITTATDAAARAAAQTAADAAAAAMQKAVDAAVSAALAYRETDTGPANGPGVKVFQRQLQNGTQGVVAFRNGLGDPASVLAARSNLTPQGDGTFSSQGGDLTLQAGEWNGVSGGALQLRVEERGSAGGYRSVAQVTAHHIALTGTEDGPFKPDNLAPWAEYGGGMTPLQVWRVGGTAYMVGFLTVTAQTTAIDLWLTGLGNAWAPGGWHSVAPVFVNDVAAGYVTIYTWGDVRIHLNRFVKNGDYIYLNCVWPLATP